MIIREIIFLSCVIQLGKGKQHYDYRVHRLVNDGWWWMDPPKMDVYDRMLLLSRQIYEDANLRVLEMDDYRFMYEETPQYEIGYLMGEVMERYRKLMEEGRMAYANLNRKYDAQRHAFTGLINRVEKAQHIYFEEYHLVRMMHEIVPKYKKSTKKMGVRADRADAAIENMITGPPELPEIFAEETEKQKAIKKKKEAAEKREKERRERMEKQRESILDRIEKREKLKNDRKLSYYEKSKVDEYTRAPSPYGGGRYMYRPFDYGWEISQRWW